MRFIGGIILLFSCWARAQTPTLVDSLRAKGFKCIAKEYGHVCTIESVQDEYFHYSQPIGILIPRKIKKIEKVLLYLHGYRGFCEPLDATLETMTDEFQFLRQIEEAGAKNSILILPTSTGNKITYEAEFVPQMAGFENWVYKLIGPNQVSWIVSGHSGAGGVIAKSLAGCFDFNRKVKAVILLDATYDMSTYLPFWMDAAGNAPEMQFQVVYMSGFETETGAQTLALNIGMNRVHTELTQASTHCAIPTVDYARLLKRVF